jgi:hypothetical protein
MSDDNNLAPKEIDIDELDVRIFMLVKDTSSMNSAVTFLKRRGWETVCHNNISKSIDTIVKDQPEVVMVSVNHPNPNVMRLPVLLSQSMNAITIGFSEKGDSMSLSKLNNSRFKHKFSGYPSGPSFHRYILQILDRVHNPHKFEDKQAKRKKSSVSRNKDSIEVNSGAAANESVRFSKGKESGPIQVKAASEDQAIKSAESKGPIIQKSSTSQIKAGPSRSEKNAANQDKAASAGTNQSAAANASKPSTEQSPEQAARAQESASRTAKASGAAYTPDRSNKEELGNKAHSSSSQSAKGRAQSKSRRGGAFEEVDEQGFKKKKRPQRKMYPWQKEEAPQEDAIKNQNSRPGASFEMKQSRKDLEKGSEEKEKQNKDSKQAGLGLQKGSKLSEGPDITAEAAKGKEFEFSQDGPKQKAADAAGSDANTGKQKHTESDGEDHDGKSNQGANAEGLSAKSKNSQQDETDSAAKDKSHEDENPDSAKTERSDPSRDLRDEPQQKDAAQADGSDRVPKGQLTESEDKFKRLMKEALKASTQEADPDVRIPIEDVEKIGVIPLNSAMISGYVVLSRGGIGFEIGSDLLDTMMLAIETTFSSQGFDVHCQKPFLVQTQQFTFDFWQDNVGLFTIFEQSQSEEIALTFLQTVESVHEMKVSKADPSMVTIQVEDIDIDIPVDFKTYIYLEKNNKFYKYLNDGRNLLPRQKHKLSANKKTKEMHIARQDFQRFQQYLARNLINQLLKQAFDKLKAA